MESLGVGGVPLVERLLQNQRQYPGEAIDWMFLQGDLIIISGIFGDYNVKSVHYIDARFFIV
jgi:hypothetical protein